MQFSLGGFLSFRAFAKMKDIARISKADENYQRDTIQEYKEDIYKFLELGKIYSFQKLF